VTARELEGDELNWLFSRAKKQVELEFVSPAAATARASSSIFFPAPLRAM
jgi:hypothetical protein